MELPAYTYDAPLEGETPGPGLRAWLTALFERVMPASEPEPLFV